MSAIKYLCDDTIFHLFSSPEPCHDTNLSFLSSNLSYPSSDPVALIRRQQPRQREPPPLHGPRPRRGHQRLWSAGQCHHQGMSDFVTF